MGVKGRSLQDSGKERVGARGGGHNNKLKRLKSTGGWTFGYLLPLPH